MHVLDGIQERASRAENFEGCPPFTVEQLVNQYEVKTDEMTDQGLPEEVVLWGMTSEAGTKRAASGRQR